MILERTGKTFIGIILICLIIVGIIGYALYQARNILGGPQVKIVTPQNGETVTNPLTEIKGMATNITFLSLNDRQIYTDASGNFDEELLLLPGYNVWTLEAKDKFGRTVSKKIELVLEEN